MASLNRGSDDGDGTTAIVAGVAGGLLVLLLGLCFCAYRRRTRARGTSSSSSQQSVDATSVTVDVQSAVPGVDAARPTANTHKESVPVVASGGLELGVTYAGDSSTSAAPTSARKQRAEVAMAQWECSAADIVWEEVIGSGGFGTVHRVRVGETALAAKRMDVAKHGKNAGGRAAIENMMMREFRALNKLDHPNIVALLGVVLDDPSWVCLLMELADRDSLRHVLNTKPQSIVDEKAVQMWIAHDIASALAYCHAQTPQPLLHHDIKSANVLLCSTDEAGALRLTAKVADFGLAVGVSSATTAAVTVRTATQAAGGTLAYRSPETFDGKYTKESEVYSYAIVLWELLTGDLPWHKDADGKPYMDVNVINLVARKGKRPEIPTALVGARAGLLPKLMRKCWDGRPRNRPTFASIEAQLKPQLEQPMSAPPPASLCHGKSPVSSSDSTMAYE